MKNTTVAGLLRAALALWTAAVLTAAAYFVPVFMRHICAVRPELAGWYSCGHCAAGRDINQRPARKGQKKEGILDEKDTCRPAGGHDAVGVFAIVAGDGDRRTRAGICAQKCHALQAGVATVGG